MRIPKRFSLLGNVYEVSLVRKSEWEDEETCGSFNPTTREIRILSGERGLREHTYLHELVHAILNAMGKDELYKEEGFVDLFSGLLHQTLVSGVSTAAAKSPRAPSRLKRGRK